MRDRGKNLEPQSRLRENKVADPCGPCQTPHQKSKQSYFDVNSITVTTRTCLLFAAEHRWFRTCNITIKQNEILEAQYIRKEINGVLSQTSLGDELMIEI